jgi:hypothetical protein
MEIEPKPVITPMSDANLTLEPALGREMVPACQYQLTGKKFQPRAPSWGHTQEHKLDWTLKLIGIPALLPRNCCDEGQQPTVTVSECTLTSTTLPLSGQVVTC